MSEEKPKTVEDKPAEKAEGRKRTYNWRERFSVEWDKKVGVADKLNIHVAVTRYNGDFKVLVVRVTEKGFAKSALPLPPEIVPELIKGLNEAVEKARGFRIEAQKQKALAEIEKLRKMGVDVRELLKALK